MVSDFDKIFTKIQAQHEAKNQSAERLRKRREREAKEEARIIESMAPSTFLRDLGIQASRRLLNSGIPLRRLSWVEESRGLFGGRKWKTVYSGELWTLAGVCLTKDGYFLHFDDHRLPGPIGFVKLVKRIRLVAPNPLGALPLHDGDIYVDAETKQFRIYLYRRIGDKDYSEVKTHDFAELVAINILNLKEAVAQGKKV